MFEYIYITYDKEFYCIQMYVKNLFNKLKIFLQEYKKTTSRWQTPFPFLTWFDERNYE